MKIIITENRLYNIILDYIEESFDVENINYTNATDDNGNDLPALSFYLYDYDDDINLFKWYDKGYFDEISQEEYYTSEQYRKWIDECPVLAFDYDNKKNELDSVFGDKWHQPFKDWFMKNFNLPIKTIV